MKKIAIPLAFIIGCSGINPVDLTADVKANPAGGSTKIVNDNASTVTDFAVKLLSACKDTKQPNKNILLSPVSVMCALGLTSNGANGVTKAEFEKIFGIPVETLNGLLAAYIKNLPQGEKYKLSSANSIWIKDDGKLDINKQFLQTAADYYNAEVYKTLFNSKALNAINSWVKKNTDGMIDKIIDKIPSDVVMYLINALAFDAKWETEYKDHEVRDAKFYKEDGTSNDIKLMFSKENVYLENANCTGFIKYYANRKYAFVGLLPAKGLTADAFIATLNGETLSALLKGGRNIKVYAYLPKFTTEYAITMNDALKSMGLKMAFTNYADFSLLANFPLKINNVIHKTYVKVDEKGTKAAAVTAVEMAKATSVRPMEEIKIVRLDRPFVYLLIDVEHKLPVFIGKAMDIAEQGK